MSATNNILAWIVDYAAAHGLHNVAEAALNEADGVLPDDRAAVRVKLSTLRTHVASRETIQEHLEEVLALLDEVVPESFSRAPTSPYFFHRMGLVVQAVMGARKPLATTLIDEYFPEMPEAEEPKKAKGKRKGRRRRKAEASEDDSDEEMEDAQNGEDATKALVRILAQLREDMTYYNEHRRRRKITNATRKALDRIETTYSLEDFQSSMATFLTHVESVCDLGNPFLETLHEDVVGSSTSGKKRKQAARSDSDDSDDSGDDSGAGSSKRRHRKKKKRGQRDDKALLEDLDSTRRKLRSSVRDPLADELAVARDIAKSRKKHKKSKKHHKKRSSRRSRHRHSKKKKKSQSRERSRMRSENRPDVRKLQRRLAALRKYEDKYTTALVEKRKMVSKSKRKAWRRMVKKIQQKIAKTQNRLLAIEDESSDESSSDESSSDESSSDESSSDESSSDESSSDESGNDDKESGSDSSSDEEMENAQGSSSESDGDNEPGESDEDTDSAPEVSSDSDSDDSDSEPVRRRSKQRSHKSVITGKVKKTKPVKSPPRVGRRRWTANEVKNLKAGVKKYGVGNWAEILDSYDFLDRRTTVDLKDKWRNLVKRGQA